MSNTNISKEYPQRTSKNEVLKVNCCSCGSEFFVKWGAFLIFKGDYSCPYCNVDNEQHISEVIDKHFGWKEGENK